MHFQFAPLSFVVVASAAIASSPLKRDGSTIVMDVNAFGSALDSFGSACSAFPSTGGTGAQANIIMRTMQAFNNAINKATADANRSPTFTETQSFAIVNATKTLEGKFTDALGKLEAKEEPLLAFPFGGVIVTQLDSLKNGTIALWAAFLPKISSNQISSAEIILGFYVAGYDGAIESFDS
ncbi:hypothetical protein BD410DRAFT_902867 [Rickenella mellea]|uniref:Uncharacterized protein n=1 Tax=Rickenella mellea TaxID=50990 RepID=A0A4Y7PHC6_9AGAM|nr:hypothetical protein BD410DRAFT_902867 [Rickenella mellea]